MEDPENIEQTSIKDDFRVEITDLDGNDNAREDISSWLEPAFLHLQRSHMLKKHHWRLASAVGILLLLVIIFNLTSGLSSLIVNQLKTALAPQSGLALQPSFTFRGRPAPLLPGQDGIGCLIDADWSPDGEFVAILGYRQCPQNDYIPVQVNVYNTFTSKLVTQLHPDDAALRAFTGPQYSPVPQTAVKLPISGYRSGLLAIYYLHIAWSPDGKRLAFTFETLKQHPAVNGVVLMNVDGSDAKVLLQQLNPSTPFFAEWDVIRNVPVVIDSPPSPFALMPLAPALAYRWGPNGALLPDRQLTDTSVPAPLPLGPVGNPNGGTSFTIWQPGFASLISLEVSSSIYSVYTWNTAFAAWSPDGRFLLDEISLSGFLKPVGERFPSHKALAATRSDRVPILPVRDAALLKVIVTSAAIAWNPNGRILAAYTSANVVSLYDCASGRKLESFYLHSASVAPSPNATVLRWSPDGSLLLLSSVTWGLVSIWGPLQLAG